MLFAEKNTGLQIYDVVHIHNSNVFCILEAILAKAAGVKKVIVHSHNTAMGGFGIRRLVKMVFQVLGKSFWPLVADEYCACSTEAGVWMFGKGAVEKGKVHILKNGIVGNKYYFNDEIRKEYRSKLGWVDKYIIGHVGRFSTQKNHTFLLDIFNEILKLEPNARLLLFGEGELKKQAVEKVLNLGLSDKVNFYGTSKEINKWLQVMDLFLFPSLYEGLPVSGIEAQAAGVPVLASDTISPEFKITDCVKWMKLNAPAKDWAQKAVAILHTKSFRMTKSEIQEQGYDIVCTAKELKLIYDED